MAEKDEQKQLSMSQLKNKTSLKGYQSQLEKLNGEREVLLFKLKGVEDELRTNNRRRKAIESRVKHIKETDLTVSEHAILRYIERIEVCNPAEVKDKIITDKLKEMVDTLGDGVYPLENCKVKVRSKTIVTVLAFEP